MILTPTLWVLAIKEILEVAIRILALTDGEKAKEIHTELAAIKTKLTEIA